MSLHRYLLVVIYGVSIVSRAVSGEEVSRPVGGQVSFKLDKIGSPVTSLTWKHITPESTVKAIEWEEGEETTTPNPRFQGITELNKVTGEITITKLRVEHSGLYTIDVSGKEQEQTFTLTVMYPVPKPLIEVEKINPDVVYLSCKNYNGTVTWSNSAGEELAHQSNKAFITVQKNVGNPENSYSCTFKNAVSEKTSDPVHKKDLFEDESTGGHWWIAVIVILPLLVIGIFFAVYILSQKFREHVDAKCSCIKGCVGAICPCVSLDTKGPATENGIDNGAGNRMLGSPNPPPEEAVTLTGQRKIDQDIETIKETP